MANLREATSEELVQWDELILKNPDGGNVLQIMAFAKTKARHGWTPQFLICEVGNTPIAVMVLTRKTPFGELWYVPKGPGVRNTAQLKEFVRQARSEKAFVVKVEPELDRIELKSVQAPGLVAAPRDLQMNTFTVVVNLRPSEDDLIASFRQKTRYNIRLAERKGVAVEPVETDQASIQQMYKLMEATRDRAGFYLRGIDYFADFWRFHAESGRGQMFFAKFEGQVLAGDFVTFIGTKALYKDGGSIREHSDLQAPYLLQWEVMRWLKARGVAEYDLHGTPPADRLDDPTHPSAGLGRFKTGFNAEITEYVGTLDLVLKPTQYKAWNRFGERAMAGYNVRVKRELFY